MEQLIIDAIESGGYLGIFFLMALENIFPPIPSEVIMGVGGLLVARGSMDFWPLLIIGTIGTTAGNWFWYWIGHKFGFERLQPFVDRWGRWLTLEWEDIVKAQLFFVKYGHWVVFFLRFSPLLRTIISLPAGLCHMPRVKFLVYTFAASLLWNMLLIKGGEWLGKRLEDSQHVLAWIIIGFVGLTLVGYVYRVVTWQERPPRDRTGSDEG